MFSSANLFVALVLGLAMGQRQVNGHAECTVACQGSVSGLPAYSSLQELNQKLANPEFHQKQLIEIFVERSSIVSDLAKQVGSPLDAKLKSDCAEFVNQVTKALANSPCGEEFTDILYDEIPSKDFVKVLDYFRPALAEDVDSLLATCVAILY